MTQFVDYSFAFILLLSVLIFVHELGHFLAAKACGVRVLKFSLGFGPAIGIGRHRLQWKRGHTEYVVAWFPLGGFVKMLGENPDEEESDPEVEVHREETLDAKPLWQKLFIVFAGPIMNLLLPVVIFVGMQAVGIPRADAVIGLVERDSPGAAAGLREGDRITAIDGEAVQWWRDVSEAIRKHPGVPLRLTIDRSGQALEVSLSVVDEKGVDEFGELTRVGWAGIDHPRPAALVGVLDVNSDAWRAGLRSGDRVMTVAGFEVEDWYGFRDAYAKASSSGLEVALDVKRVDADEVREILFTVRANKDLAALGVIRASTVVDYVEPDSAASRAGLRKKDLILEFGGRRVEFFYTFARAVRASEGRPLPLVFARDGEIHQVEIAAEMMETENDFGFSEARLRIGISGYDTVVTGAISLDQASNPFVAVPRAVAMTVDFTRIFLVGVGKLVTGEVSSKNLAGPIGIAQMAGSAYEQGWDSYLRLMILISINLGILNLLPIPVLDGGQAMLFIIEGVRRSPLSLRSKVVVQQIGVTMLLLLMGLAFWNDLTRIWSKVVDWLPRGL